MGISGVALQPKTTGSPSPQNDSSAEIQKLEQQKRDIRQQIKQLEQSKQGGDAIQKAKNNLQKQLQEIDRQIQTLKQQGTQETQKATEAPPAEEAAQARPPRFDEYVKNDKEASSAGIYNVEKDENGNPLITFDSPDKPSQESPDTAKAPSEDEKPEIMKCTVSTDKVDAEIKKLTEQRQSIQQQLKQAENPEEKAALQKQLTNIETELRAKDNDAYRKQNATYTYSKES